MHAPKVPGTFVKMRDHRVPVIARFNNQPLEVAMYHVSW
jgi:hypothetical protein